jgi:5-methylcytosine-specific restriction endonuclease McrA
MDYQEYIQSEEWKQRAHEAKRRAGWQCAVCASTKSLEAHHRTYDRLGRERPQDLVVLCWRCHRRHHDTLTENYRRAIRYEQLRPFVHRFPVFEELN